MTTGCEIGIYNTQGPDIDIPNTFKGTFFRAVKDEEMLNMKFSLYKGGIRLFTRSAKHWWLTGFKLGEFSQPSELAMDISICLLSSEMRDAFVSGLKRTGYKDSEIKIRENWVSLTFDKPYSQQPFTRKAKTEVIIQRKNKLLCDQYIALTSDYNTFSQKINALQEKSPELYNAAITLGKPVLLFESFDIIKKYLK